MVEIVQVGEWPTTIYRNEEYRRGEEVIGVLC
jgi:hypothetical protein